MLLWSQTVLGQAVDTLVIDEPKEPISWRPQALRVGVDLSQIARQIIFDEFTSLYEVHADLGLHNYFLVVDYGHAESKRQKEDFDYTNNGNYLRLGLDVNFLKKDRNQTVVFFGIRYATSTFKDMLEFDRVDAFGNHQLLFQTNGSKANWFEVNMGLKVKIWKGLYLGYTARYKFGLQLKNQNGLIPLDIPGYGKFQIDDTDNFGFNYHLFWRFPLSKSMDSN
ncbi:MAG: DUF6048 family protein [Cyclobacteriaceae bacterium]